MKRFRIYYQRIVQSPDRFILSTFARDIESDCTLRMLVVLVFSEGMVVEVSDLLDHGAVRRMWIAPGAILSVEEL